MERKILTAVAVVSVLLSATNISVSQQSQQVVGSTTLGVAYAELRDVATGWSAKRQILAGTTPPFGVIPFRNLKRSLSVERTRVVFSAMMDL